jgi:hypothetical protein
MCDPNRSVLVPSRRNPVPSAPSSAPQRDRSVIVRDARATCCYAPSSLRFGAGMPHADVRRMRLSLLFLGPLYCITFACSSTPNLVLPCPSGWTSSDQGYSCNAPSSVVASMHAKLTSGVWGFARVSTYSPPSTTTSSKLLAHTEIHLVHSGPATDPPGGTAISPVGSSGKCVFSADPVAIAMTDDQGIFAIEAPPGSYDVEMCAAHAGTTGMIVPSATVGAAVVEHNLDFNDIPQ